MTILLCSRICITFYSLFILCHLMISFVYSSCSLFCSCISLALALSWSQYWVFYLSNSVSVDSIALHEDLILVFSIYYARMTQLSFKRSDYTRHAILHDVPVMYHTLAMILLVCACFTLIYFFSNNDYSYVLSIPLILLNVPAHFI